MRIHRLKLSDVTDSKGTFSAVCCAHCGGTNLRTTRSRFSTALDFGCETCGGGSRITFAEYRGAVRVTSMPLKRQSNRAVAMRQRFVKAQTV